MTEAEFVKLVLEFPGSETGTSYGRPSFKVRGKFFTRIRSEDESAVLPTADLNEREHLIEMEPDCFHFTDHYRNYPTVLARLKHLDSGLAKSLLERRWRTMVTKAMLKTYDTA